MRKPKALISNRIYLEVTDEYKEKLSEELTYVIPTYNPKDPPMAVSYTHLTLPTKA